MRFLLFLSLCLVSCETASSKEEQKSFVFEPYSLAEGESLCEEFSFQGMGTFWKVLYCTGTKSVKQSFLRASFLDLISQYDETFSNWSQESELAHLTAKSFSKPQKASPLFLKALLQAQKLFYQTERVFDVSQSTGNWEKIKVFPAKSSFFFEEEPPEKLDFNGFVKGMAVGALASLLEKNGISSFYINAGNGNLAYRVEGRHRDLFPLDKSDFPKGNHFAYFLSQSRSMQEHGELKHQHIHNYQKKTSFDQEARVLCYGSRDSLVSWEELGALSDAFSTALTIKKELALPSLCLKLSDS